MTKVSAFDIPPKPVGTELTQTEFAIAFTIAREKADETARFITSATASLSSGTVKGNLGHPCTSGTLLKIELTGLFPTISTTGNPGTKSGPVRLVAITADPKSGRTCEIGVGTERRAPDPDATILFTHL